MDEKLFNRELNNAIKLRNEPDITLPIFIINLIIIPVLFIWLGITSPLPIPDKTVILIMGFLVVEAGAYALIVIITYEFIKRKMTLK